MTGASLERALAAAEISALGLDTRALNERILAAVEAGARRIVLRQVQGQRYIGTNLARWRQQVLAQGLADPEAAEVHLEIHGVPGNDLAAFANGLTITVYGNAQDGVGNTMVTGTVVIHGYAGDVIGMSMLGGEIYIRDSVGYRVGIHMKGFPEHPPAIVIGGTAQDFLGEYLAGGTIVLLGLGKESHEPLAGRLVATGMHGGLVYARGQLKPWQLGKEAGIAPLDEEDWSRLRYLVGRWAEFFGTAANSILDYEFIKIYPRSSRPYGILYTSAG